MDVVMELLRGGDASEISRSYGISQSELFEWRDRFLEGGKESLKSRNKDPERDKKIKHLERLVGRLTMENEILKKSDEMQRKRRSIS
jgi:transposase